MDFRSMLDQVKSAFVIGKGNAFLHGQSERRQEPDEPQQSGRGYAPGYQAPYQQPAAPYGAEGMYQAPEQGYYQQPVQQSAPQAAQQSVPQQGYYQMPPQQAAQAPWQQPAQAQQASWQMPQQAAWQQSAPQGTQQRAPQSAAPRPQQSSGFQTQIDPFGQVRNRRGSRHREEPEAAWAQPQAENLVQFPGADRQQAAAPQQVDAYVINVFNLNSCRQAMSCLRRGQCTLIVMDQLFDKAEIRRYVDMLTGACYALGGTMTRLSSKIGFYIMAPSGMTVYTDPTTSNANAGRPAVPQAAYAPAAEAAAPRAGEFSSQGGYGAAPQMSFSASAAEPRPQTAAQGYEQGYDQSWRQGAWRQDAAGQEAGRADPYDSQQEAARYAQ